MSLSENLLPARMSAVFRETGAGGRDRLPKYLQLCEVIRRLIDGRELGAGDKLPPESALAAALPVSLGTVQKALGLMTDRGILVRIQGSGTYVASFDGDLHDLWHFRFIDPATGGVMGIQIHTLTIEQERLAGPWSAFLGPDQFHVCVSRRIEVAQRFDAISKLYLRGDTFGRLLGEDPLNFDGLLLRNVIEDRFGLATIEVRQRVECASLPGDVCHWLGLPAGSLGLVNRIEAFSFQQQPLSYQALYVPPGAAALEIREKIPGKSH